MIRVCRTFWKITSEKEIDKLTNIDNHIEIYTELRQTLGLNNQ